jgi:DNA-binding MarR family transcriptional regulator
LECDRETFENSDAAATKLKSNKEPSDNGIGPLTFAGDSNNAMAPAMPATDKILLLTASQAACLEAVNLGLNRKTKIALHAKRDLKTVANALDSLNQAKLIERADPYTWRPTKTGEACVPDVVPDRGRGRRGPAPGGTLPGSAAERLLATLVRPMSGKELAQQLGVTRQRVLQLVVRFYAEEKVRFGDPERPLQIVARNDDQSVLLTRDEERLLSALPEEASTTAAKLKAAVSMPAQVLQMTISALVEKGLLTQSLSYKGVALYELTADGQKHFQRRPPLHFAEPAPLPVKSDRVRAVLSYLAEHGEARIRDIGNDLGVSRQSMNALMQYLKRKGLAGKAGNGLHDPYALTNEGNTTLSEMMRRSSTRA